MKKTISITLNSLVFILEEDAYQALQAYFSDIKAHMSRTNSSEDLNEIMFDIEASVADKFEAKISSQKQVITIDDVEDVKSVLGGVTDFEQEDDTEESGTTHKKRKGRTARKLYRNTDDMVIAGVCSGIAAYFGIDPIIVRLLFGISVFFGGFGIVAYLILWLAVKKAETNTQKLEMQGDPITLRKIERLVRKKTKSIDQVHTGGFKRFMNGIFRCIGKMFRVLGKCVVVCGVVLGVIIGASLIVSLIFSIIGIGFGAASLLFNLDTFSFYTDFPITEYFGGLYYQIGIIAAFLVLVIPLIFLLLLGITLVSRKNVFRAALNWSLIGVWMIAAVIFGVMVVKLAPQIERAVYEFEAHYDALDADDVISKTFQIEPVTHIEVSDTLQVHITQGDEVSVIASGRSHDIERLDLRAYGNTLSVGFRHPAFCVLCRNQARVDIVLPELTHVSGSGASRVAVEGFTGDDFMMAFSGASQGTLQIAYQSTEGSLSGSSQVTLTGFDGTPKPFASHMFPQALVVNLSGASELEATTYEVNNAELTLSGASRAWVYPSDTLQVWARQASAVYYEGNPSIEEHLSESGRVQPIGNVVE